MGAQYIGVGAGYFVLGHSSACTGPDSPSTFLHFDLIKGCLVPQNNLVTPNHNGKKWVGHCLSKSPTIKLFEMRR